jgi:hypothetical protein
VSGRPQQLLASIGSFGPTHPPASRRLTTTTCSVTTESAAALDCLPPTDGKLTLTRAPLQLSDILSSRRRAGPPHCSVRLGLRGSAKPPRTLTRRAGARQSTMLLPQRRTTACGFATVQGCMAAICDKTGLYDHKPQDVPLDGSDASLANRRQHHGATRAANFLWENLRLVGSRSSRPSRC